MGRGSIPGEVLSPHAPRACRTKELMAPASRRWGSGRPSPDTGRGSGPEVHPPRARASPCKASTGNNELPPWDHYGPGGDAFLVGLVVGEGDGLVTFSSTR